MRWPIAHLLAVACVLCAGVPTGAATKRASVNEPSRGDPKVLALIGQAIESVDVVKRGSTVVELCTIRDRDGDPAYTIYWFYHLTQAAVQVHGRAELVLISAAGKVLGAYDYEGLDAPRCAGGKIYPEDDFSGDNAERYVTLFPPDRLPRWLGDGGKFSRASRYRHASTVDGIRLPRAVP
jgi:hypothetical protein